MLAEAKILDYQVCVLFRNFSIVFDCQPPLPLSKFLSHGFNDVRLPRFSFYFLAISLTVYFLLPLLVPLLSPYSINKCLAKINSWFFPLLFTILISIIF